MKKIILITGGGSGIGAESAKQLSSEGNVIIICGRTIKKLKEISRYSSNIYYYQCDVSDEENIRNMYKYVNNNFDRVDVIINCAGTLGEIGRIDKTNVDNWKKTIEINLIGNYLIIRYFLKLLLKSEIKKIINFAGGGAFNTFPNYSGYAVSKSGIVRLTENTAEELRNKGVKINCISPGMVNTDIHKKTIKAGKKKAGKKYYDYIINKSKKGSVPIEVPINCIKFLISSESGRLTGKTISASFDKWESPIFKKYIDEINDSDLFTSKRINLRNLEEKYRRKKFYNELVKLYKQG